MVLEALDPFGIPRSGDGHKRTGHVPFGFAYLIRNSFRPSRLALTDSRLRWVPSGFGWGRLRADAPQRPCWGAPLEEGLRHAARTPRVSGPRGGWIKKKIGGGLGLIL
jgi:hypothetical protein